MVHTHIKCQSIVDGAGGDWKNFGWNFPFIQEKLRYLI